MFNNFQLFELNYVPKIFSPFIELFEYTTTIVYKLYNVFSNSFILLCDLFPPGWDWTEIEEVFSDDEIIFATELTDSEYFGVWLLTFGIIGAFIKIFHDQLKKHKEDNEEGNSEKNDNDKNDNDKNDNDKNDNDKNNNDKNNNDKNPSSDNQNNNNDTNSINTDKK